MAQVDSKQKETGRRIVRVVRGNPVYLIVAAIAAAVLCGACVLGALQADGIVIERDGDTVEGDLEGVLDEAGGVDEEGSTDVPQGQGEPSDEGADAPEPDAPASEPSSIVVDVAGAVVNPSVVTLPAGARVNDAIQAVGGLSPDADVSSISRAKVLADGEQVFVPVEGQAAPAPGVSGGGASPSTGSTGQGEPSVVNINSAGIDELDTLPGVGPSTAQAIVDDRTQNGPFASPEDLMRVSGIGEKKFEKLSSLICV